MKQGLWVFLLLAALQNLHAETAQETENTTPTPSTENIKKELPSSKKPVLIKNKKTKIPKSEKASPTLEDDAPVAPPVY